MPAKTSSERKRAATARSAKRADSGAGGRKSARKKSAPKKAKKPSKVPGKRSASRAPLTLQSVLETARELLTQEGLQALSLRGVANRMGVTAPALYAHVDDKFDLMRKLGEEGFQHLMDRFESIPQDDPLEEIREIARVYVDFARSNREQFMVMFLFPTPVVGPPDRQSLINSARAYAMATDAVQRAVRAGLLRRQDPTLIAPTLWSAVHGVTMTLITRDTFDPALQSALMASLVDTLLKGFSR